MSMSQSFSQVGVPPVIIHAWRL